MSLSAGFKATMAVVGILGSGAAVGKHLQQASATQLRVAALQVEVDTVKAQSARLTADVAAIRGLIRQQLCLTIAERERTEWRRCLTPAP